MMKKFIIISACFLISFNSCKKYEEGPLLSLYSKKKRLTGQWIFISVSYNEIDSTSNYFQSVVIFNETGTLIYGDQKENDIIAIAGKWELVEKKEKLRLSLDSSLHPFYEGDWTIKRFNYYDLWIEITDSMHNNIRWELLKSK